MKRGDEMTVRISIQTGGAGDWTEEEVMYSRKSIDSVIKLLNRNDFFVKEEDQ